jgi:hypothetical protein
MGLSSSTLRQCPCGEAMSKTMEQHGERKQDRTKQTSWQETLRPDFVSRTLYTRLFTRAFHAQGSHGRKKLAYL